MYIYNLGQSLTLLTGAPAPGTAAVYLLSSEELDRNPQLPGLEGGRETKVFPPDNPDPSVPNIGPWSRLNGGMGTDLDRKACL